MEKEIDLIDYIKIILKRKWTIIGITLGAVIIAGILNWTAPKSYRASATLDIGNIAGTVPETSTQVKEKINHGTYNGVLREKLKTTNLPSIEASVFDPKETDLVIIEATAKASNKSKEALKVLSNIILGEHREFFEEKENFIKEDIKKEEEKNAILEKSKNFPELQYLYVEHLSRINQLEQFLALAISTRLIKEPSEVSVSQNILTNVIIAAILGIFLGTIVAFFQEFLEKNKERLRTKK